MTESQPALAHSANQHNEVHTLRDHLLSVAELAREFARALGAEEEAFAAGLAHDLGKYGPLFQERLRGRARRIDHWSPGAWAAYERWKETGMAATLAIEGHHLGLQEASAKRLEKLDPKRKKTHPEDRRYSESDCQRLLDRLEGDGLELPASSIFTPSIYPGQNHPHQAAAMLDIRMLFSCLVDADFLDTEAHFLAPKPGAKYQRPAAPRLRPGQALAVLDRHLEQLAQDSQASPEMKRLRADLLQACRSAAAHPPGLFTLTAPTGAGKTLSMLAFALTHARKHGLRRVVMVIPYLSIIEQTVQAYRQVLRSWIEPDELEAYLLEHHSLAGIHPRQDRDDEKDADQDDIRRLRLSQITQNWDAPLVVTTSVQMLESLFSNRPSACRKLHRLAQSVILFDEVQTIPQELALPTLATLAHLSHRYQASVVFSTATQPAFTELSRAVQRLGGVRWQPREIVPRETRLFQRCRRTFVHWPKDRKRLEWDELAQRMAEQGRALCIVNIKRHAQKLFHLLREQGHQGLFHLSTNMCPAHRQDVLRQVRERLEQPDIPCLLVSTQCVEAGVDLDFPVVYRALGPLEAVAQAAGRCNRRGLLECGQVHVFKPPLDENAAYPDPSYQQAANVCEQMLATLGPHIEDPELFSRYYRKLFKLSRLENMGKHLDLAIRIQDFKEVALQYRLIRQRGINLLTAYDPEACRRLAEEVNQQGINRRWIKKSRPFTVSIFENLRTKIDLQLEPVPLPNRVGYAPDWYILPDPEAYHPHIGLDPQDLGEASFL